MTENPFSGSRPNGFSQKTWLKSRGGDHWSAKPKLNSPTYGFGFVVAGKQADRIVGHGGGFAGISSNLDMFLDSGYTAAVMSNYDNGARPVQEKMRELLAARR